MAEKNGEKKGSAKKRSVKRPATKSAAAGDKMPSAAAKAQDSGDMFAAKQQRSLIMFVASVVLTSVIFIPGDMVWLWLHNAVRGVFSITALFWPMMLLFLAIATMLDKEIPRLIPRTAFAAGLAVALNACIYIFRYDGSADLRQAFTDGITYIGGGALGCCVGIPFIKLFGVIPAKILIILALLVLIVFTLGIPVKKLYTSLFHFVTAKLGELMNYIKTGAFKGRPAKVTDDDYFGENEYDEYDIDEMGGEELDGDNDLDDLDGFEQDGMELPSSPVLSDESFVDDEDETFPEEPEEPDGSAEPEKAAAARAVQKEDSGYSIDIDIDGPAPSEKAHAAADKDDDIDYSELFGEDFLDTMEEGYRPDAKKAAKIAQEISLSKTQGAMPSGESTAAAPVKKTASAAKSETKRRSKKAYVFPPTELLSESKNANVNYERELKENAKKLIATLESFSVGAKIIGYSRGPSVTRYEIQPAPGVKIAKITGLSDDIALNLAAEGGVRMEAPIPGKAAIGVEIPNKTVAQVTMRELLSSKEFSKNKKTKKLECVLGKDVAGKIVTMDLSQMPHLLIAGTTGSGKSVCVNSILMSILYRATPDEVKLILIDPKLVEFSKYKGIPHLLVPVVSDVKKAAGALGWAVQEMEDRYKELSLYNVKDIDSYNRMVDKNLAEMTPEEIEEAPNMGGAADGEFVPPKAVKKMPKIVIAIDELADLMMAAPGEVEDYICRLAQKARAAGMHLVIATQRPSVNVITGVIKANIPSRISLKVASFVDSKTILDTGGGEKLIGKGDMLYSPSAMPKPLRVQGGFSTDEDIEAVTDFIKDHTSSNYDDDIAVEIDRISENVGTKGGGAKETDPDDIDDTDEMLEAAIEVVVELGQASTSLLQRRLRIGYARAGRLIDTMEKMHIVGPHMGSKSREVLITKQEWLERKALGVSNG